jgi:SPP1 family predicted phage head-tail adaptor
MPLPAGILRETVVIETPQETRNALGESVQTWSTFATRRASVVADSYQEMERRQQIGGMISHTVRMRYVEGLTGKMRLRWTSRGDRILYISSVVERNFREEHELSCEEQAT